MSDASTQWKEMTGPAYQSLSKYSAVERCVNFFPEVIEDPNETKSRVVLYPTPCTGLYGELPSDQFKQTARALLELNGTLFGINGTQVFQFYPPNSGPFQPNPQGSFVPLGLVANDGLPAYMIANGVIVAGMQQIFISSAGLGYILTPNPYPTPPTLTQLDSSGGFLAGQGATFLDDYFISIIPNTNGFQVSAVNNGTSWDPTAVAFTQGQSDALLNLIADRELLWLFGSRRAEIWYNTGALGFPFAIQPGAFIEIGLGAAASLIQADNSLFWLGRDKRGGVSAWRANGLTPVRVSNHAVEQAWSKYSTVEDAIFYSFIWRGHTFIRCIFPTADASWTYDCAASQMLGYSVWHENTFTDNNGIPHACLERTHAYFQGTHVVGSGGADSNAGTLYEFTDSTTMDADPKLQLRYSDDGGQIFGAWRDISVGSAGQYNTRVIANLLGSSRDRVFWVRCVDLGEASGNFHIVRDRICPHIWDNNNRVYYSRLEIETQKGIGFEGGATDGFWALVTAELTMDQGLN